MGLGKVAAESTSLFQKFSEVIDVDDWHNEFRIEDRNIALSRIGLYKLVDRFGIERVQRTFARWLIVKLPKLLCDVPRHCEVTAGRLG